MFLSNFAPMNTCHGRAVRLVRWMMTVVATMLLLVIPCGLAHHHHGSRLCAVVERCATDHAVNDRHTRHHGDNAPCVKQQLAAAPVKHVSHADNGLVPLAALTTAGIAVPPPCSHELFPLEQGFVSSASSIACLDGCGLRAPPSLG